MLAWWDFWPTSPSLFLFRHIFNAHTSLPASLPSFASLLPLLNHSHLHPPTCLPLRAPGPGNEGVTLLLYTLLHSSSSFLDYVLVRSDVETLLVPLLRQLYGASKARPNHLYMLQVRNNCCGHGGPVWRRSHDSMPACPAHALLLLEYILPVLPAVATWCGHGHGTTLAPCVGPRLGRVVTWCVSTRCCIC